MQQNQWKYLYRAVDSSGKTIDFLLTAKRDTAAALRFFRKAIRHHGQPEVVTIDKSGANTATRFAELGKQVLAFDLDPQGNLSTVLSGGQYDFDMTVADLFDKPKRVDVHAAIIQGKANEEPIPNLYLVPADIRLSRVIEQSLTQIHRERILMRHLDKLDGQFDIILLDCPPNLSLTSTNAMMAADMFLIPVDGGSFSLNGLADLLDALEEVKETEQVPYFAFRNELAKQNKLINEFLDEQLQGLRERIGERGTGGVLNASIRREERYGHFWCMGG